MKILIRLVDWRNFAVDGMGSDDIRRSRIESWECPTCQVRWVSTEPRCWICGQWVEN